MSLLQSLESRQGNGGAIYTRRQLVSIWQRDRDFLFNEVAAFIHLHKHKELRAAWPPL
jgi:hypothetical protein